MAETVETPLLRVPFESLKRTTRDRKYVIDEANLVLEQLQKNAGDTQLSQEQRLQDLSELVTRLQGLKRKLDDLTALEAADIQRCRARLEHLRAIGIPATDSVLDWNRTRLDRILVDHLLRTGCHSTALRLAEESGVKNLVDIHIFEGARGVLGALQRHDCSAALAWCSTNQSKLTKIKSKLEFKLRLQEFIELVRAGHRMQAVAYAKQHLSVWASSYMPELQRAIALLVFSVDTPCAPYKELLHEQQWSGLVDLFRNELYRLNNLTPESLLVIHLKAGLSALKTPQSYEEGSSREDPLHAEPFQSLAQGLPYAKHEHSKLVCAITREVMNEHNPPMVLPDGAVYSERAVQECAARNGGAFICPLTGAVYNLSEIRRAYIS